MFVKPKTSTMIEIRVCKLCECISSFVAFVTAFLILSTPIGTPAFYVYFTFLIVALVVLICHFASCKKESHEQNRTGPRHNVQQQPIQVLPTPPTDFAGINQNHGGSSRSSMGRILVPVGDEESIGCSPVLSADFGDDEIFSIKETACSICLVDYQHGEEIQRNGLRNVSGEATPCDHIFHPKCISTWIQSSGKSECPFCRGPFHLNTPSAPSISDID
jgi:Ring finger domain